MGLGFKDWSAGDKPTAAEFDGYLQRQTVMVFASTSARDTALSGNLEEGMVAYNSDDDQFWTYDGSNWVPFASTRYGCSLSRSTNQTLAASSGTTVTYDSEDADVGGFYPGTGGTVTIPSNMGGLYSVSFFYDTDVTGLSSARLFVGSGSGYFAAVGGEVGAGSLVLPLSAADTVSLYLNNTTPAGNIEAAELHVYRIGA